MSELQATETGRTAGTETSVSAFEMQLGAEVLNGLAKAIDNAVVAQQQLYVTGQAAFTMAVSQRLSGEGRAPEPAAGAEQTPTAEDLEEAFRQRVEAKLAAAGSEAGPAQLTRGLMTAFAESLDMLAAVNAQQMMDYVRVILALGFDYQGELSPAAAKALEEVYDGQMLVQLLGALEAERHAFEPSEE